MNTNFFVKDMGMGFPTNLLTSDNSKLYLSKLLDFLKLEAGDEEYVCVCVYRLFDGGLRLFFFGQITLTSHKISQNDTFKCFKK